MGKAKKTILKSGINRRNALKKLKRFAKNTELLKKHKLDLQ